MHVSRMVNTRRLVHKCSSLREKMCKQFVYSFAVMIWFKYLCYWLMYYRFLYSGIKTIFKPNRLNIFKLFLYRYFLLLGKYHTQIDILSVNKFKLLKFKFHIFTIFTTKLGQYNKYEICKTITSFLQYKTHMQIDFIFM